MDQRTDLRRQGSKPEEHDAAAVAIRGLIYRIRVHARLDAGRLGGNAERRPPHHSRIDGKPLGRTKNDAALSEMSISVVAGTQPRMERVRYLNNIVRL
ncbi:MAG: hypothetical protein OYH76_06555 [Defluviicoccus sp.]|nr:hypothetical protein [Defluviicoccus sp.]